MSKIRVTSAAEHDLTNIWLHIGENNPLAADRVFESAQLTFNRLSETPKIGKAFDSKRPKLNGIRFFPIQKYPNYVVYYREIDNGIEIIRVLHARMLKEGRLNG